MSCLTTVAKLYTDLYFLLLGFLRLPLLLQSIRLRLEGTESLIPFLLDLLSLFNFILPQFLPLASSLNEVLAYRLVLSYGIGLRKRRSLFHVLGRTVYWRICGIVV